MPNIFETPVRGWTMNAFTERRKHERISVTNLSCVLVSPVMVLSYEVLDISNDGLAFSYAGWENWPRKEMRLDFIDQKFCLEDIPIRVIKDVGLDKGSKKLRRCSVKFTDLNVAQKTMLRHYIESVMAH
jgi:tRNA-binding EMAP/Myf-like protein